MSTRKSSEKKDHDSGLLDRPEGDSGSDFLKGESGHGHGHMTTDSAGSEDKDTHGSEHRGSGDQGKKKEWDDE